MTTISRNQRMARFGLLGMIAAGLAWAAWILFKNGPAGVAFLPPCWFHKITGLDCPGCGMTRASYELLHGNLWRAFLFNPLATVLLPVAVIGAGLELVGWATDRPPPWRIRVGARCAWGLVIAILAFWVLRNLPWWPFTLLSPTG